MPTFNDRLFIGESIDSVVCQTLENWELIVIDDASTDGTGDYVRAEFNDERIRVVTMDTNSGSGTCRNRAIELSRGEFIAVLDADDVCMPSRLDIQAQALLSDPTVSVVASQVLEFGNWGGPVPGKWPTDESQVRIRQGREQMPVPHPTVMFRRSILQRVGGYDTACRRAQDFALFLKLSNERIICIEEPLVAYRTSRPVSLRYVIQNDQYANLALRRHHLREMGCGEKDLPLHPQVGIGLLAKSLRNWSVRNLRELLSRPIAS